eukprot:tig00020713_g13410.t1
MARARETGMFVNPPSVNDDLHCPICFCIFEGPMRVSCPGKHTFCKVCHDELFRNGAVVTCPTCRQEIRKDASEENKDVEGELRQRSTFCPFKDDGCDWEGPLWKRERHGHGCQAKQACRGTAAGCKRRMHPDNLAAHEAKCRHLRQEPRARARPRPRDEGHASFLVTVPNYLERKEETGEGRGSITIAPAAHAGDRDSEHCPWQMRMNLNGTKDDDDEDLEDYLGVFLQRADGAPFQTDFTIKLVNKDRTKNVSWDAEMDDPKVEHGDAYFKTLSTLADPAAGFLHGGALLFLVEIGPKGPDAAQLLEQLESEQRVRQRLEVLHTALEGRESFVVIVPNYLKRKEDSGEGRRYNTFTPENNRQWKLVVAPNGENSDSDGDGRSKEHLAVYLERADGAPFKTDFTIKLLNKDPTKDVVDNCKMKESEDSFGRSRFKDLCHVADPAAGFLCGGTLAFLVEIGPKGPDAAQLLEQLESEQRVRQRLEVLHTTLEGRESFVVIVPNYLKRKEDSGEGRRYNTFTPENNRQWKLVVAPNGENSDSDGDGRSKEHLAVYLERADGAPFKTDFTIKLLNKGPTKDVVDNCKMKESEDSFGRSRFEDLCQVADPAAGFLCGGTLTFLVEIGPKGPDAAQLLEQLESEQRVRQRLEVLHTALEGRESFVVIVPNYLKRKEAAGEGRRCILVMPENNRQWKLVVAPNGQNGDGRSKEHLAVYLEQADGAPFKTDFTIKLLNKDPTKDVVANCKMKESMVSLGRHCFQSLALVADPAAGFLCGGTLAFLVEIGPKGLEPAQLLQRAKKAEGALAAAQEEAAAIRREQSSLLADAAAKQAELEVAIASQGAAEEAWRKLEEENVRLKGAAEEARRELEAERRARAATASALEQLKRTTKRKFEEMEEEFKRNMENAFQRTMKRKFEEMEGTLDEASPSP